MGLLPARVCPARRSSRFINFGAGRRIRPDAKAARDQNCVIGERSGCVRMAACGHLTHRRERAACRCIKLGVGAPISSGQLATGNQDRSIGKARSRGEFLTDRACDGSECPSHRVVDLSIGRARPIVTACGARASLGRSNRKGERPLRLSPLCC